MLSRSFAIVFASFLPAAALILPLGPAHTISAVVAGTLAMLLAGLSFAYDRARFGVAALGAWVALTAFIFPSTFVEQVLTVCWGTMMFAAMAGPLSEMPRQLPTAAIQSPQEPAAEQSLQMAA
jgi:hypothetical protein